MQPERHTQFLLFELKINFQFDANTSVKYLQILEKRLERSILDTFLETGLIPLYGFRICLLLPGRKMMNSGGLSDGKTKL